MTTTVSPIGAGTITVVDDGDHGEDLGSFAILTATPATGYKFDHWECDVVESYQEYYEASPTVYNTHPSDYGNPTTRRVTGGYDRPNYWGQGKWSRYSYELTAATAYFIPAADPDPQPPVTTTITVTFDGNATGAEVAPSSRDYTNPTAATTYGTLPTPNLPGARFLGWFTASTGGTQVTAASALVSLSSHTLYAHFGYQINAYCFGGNAGAPFNVAVNSQIGSHTGTNWYTLASAVVERGTTATISAILGDGYAFDSWTLTVGIVATTGTVVADAGPTFAITPTQDTYYRLSCRYIGPVDIHAKAGQQGTSSTAVQQITVVIDDLQPAAEAVKTNVAQGASITLSAPLFAQLFNDVFWAYYHVHFVRWTKESSGYSDSSEDTIATTSPCTTTVPVNQAGNYYTDDWYYLAVYAAAAKITLAADPPGSGTASFVTPSDFDDPGWFSQGARVTVEATAARGYQFTNWTIDGVEVSTSATYTLTASSYSEDDAAKITNLVAHFAQGGSTCIFKTYYHGQEIIRSVAVTPGQTVPIGELPTPPAYINTTMNKERTFLGWFTAETGGDLVTATCQITSGQTYTFHAHWQRIIEIVVRSSTAGFVVLRGVATASGSIAVSPVDTPSPAVTSAAPESVVTCEGGLYGGGGRLDGMRVTWSNETTVAASGTIPYLPAQVGAGFALPTTGTHLHDDLRLLLLNYSLKLISKDGLLARAPNGLPLVDA